MSNRNLFTDLAWKRVLPGAVPFSMLLAGLPLDDLPYADDPPVVELDGGGCILSFVHMDSMQVEFRESGLVVRVFDWSFTVAPDSWSAELVEYLEGGPYPALRYAARIVQEPNRAPVGSLCYESVRGDRFSDGHAAVGGYVLSYDPRPVRGKEGISRLSRWGEAPDSHGAPGTEYLAQVGRFVTAGGKPVTAKAFGSDLAGSCGGYPVQLRDDIEELDFGTQIRGAHYRRYAHVLRLVEPKLRELLASLQ